MTNSHDKNLEEIYSELGNFEYDPRNNNLLRFIARQVKGKSVLDIGCGSGKLINFLNSKGKRALGIEPNAELIKLSRNKKIIHGEAEEIDKIFKKKVDNIIMVNSLEHVKDDKKLIQKLYRHINKKGRLIIFVPAFKFLHGIRDTKYGDYRRYSKKELSQLLIKNKFKIAKARHWNMIAFFPYCFYEKVLHKEWKVAKWRTKSKNPLQFLINRFLNLWFRYIENNINLGFGVNLMCAAEK